MILLTGSTGFLGSEILRQHTTFYDEKIIILVRGKTRDEITKKVALLKQRLNERRFHQLTSVVVGDVTKPDLGLDSRHHAHLLENVDSVIHCAATIGFNISYDYGKAVNVEGTRNIVQFVNDSKKVRKFSYIGTTFIAGDLQGRYCESDFDKGQNFHNNYERTKFEAEALARQCINKDIVFLVFRPSIIVGNSQSGETNNFEVFYKPIRLFSTGIFSSVPADPSIPLNLIPVDFAANAILSLHQEVARNEILHIISPNDIISGYFMERAANLLQFKNPRFIPLKDFDIETLTPVQDRLLRPHIPYFNYKVTFCNRKTRDILKKINAEIPFLTEQVIDTLITFCRKSNFIR